MKTVGPLLLPTGDAGLERACILCREQPALEPLVFEALLYAPLAVLIEPVEPAPLPARPVTEQDSVIPMQIRNLSIGLTEFCNAVFSDIAHFRAFARGRARQCTSFENGRIPIMQLVSADSPLVVDPGARHALWFSREEMRTWLADWEDGASAPDSFERDNYEFSRSYILPQLLLDRLAVFLPRFHALERAYLCFAGPPGTAEWDWRFSLMVDCADSTAVERIRRALPLLSQSLPPEVVPQCVATIAHDPGYRNRAAALLPPVYDRSMTRWLGKR